jgi:hypothetical protein
MEEYLTIRQIAGVLGVPIETIRVRFHRANKYGYPLPKSRSRVINGRKVKEYEFNEFLRFMDFFRPPRNSSFYRILKKERKD